MCPLPHDALPNVCCPATHEQAYVGMPFTSCLAHPSVEACQLTPDMHRFWQPPFELRVSNNIRLHVATSIMESLMLQTSCSFKHKEKVTGSYKSLVLKQDI